jgi:hypothetical protein
MTVTTARTTLSASDSTREDVDRWLPGTGVPFAVAAVATSSTRWRAEMLGT